jgi:predicted transcriptional regulator
MFKRKTGIPQKTLKIEVPTELPGRIQNIAEQTKLSYSELLRKWIAQEENIINAEHYEEDLLKWRQHVEAQLIALQRQVFNLQRTSADEGIDEQEYRRTLLKKIKSLRDQGMTFVKISEQFNNEGIATVTGTGRWYPSSISQFLAKNGGV